jgi:SsrA-binding protein
MHRKEIATLERKQMEKGLSIIPLSVYFNDRGKAKVQIALARGKSNYDKRDSIAKDDTRREIDRMRSEKL